VPERSDIDVQTEERDSVSTGGLVTRNGSWDTDAPLGAVYRHTDLGRLVVETLSSSSVWTSMYDRSGTENAHSWKR